MISSVAAANYILGLADADHRKRLTPLQLMKLVYMAHGWHLAVTEMPLIPDRVQAWQYGPVIPSLYQAMKSFGSLPIDPPKLPTGFFGQSDPQPEQKETLKSVYENYGHLSGIALSSLTHRPGSPWFKTWKPGVSSLVIPNEVIKQHYKEVKAKNALHAA